MKIYKNSKSKQFIVEKDYQRAVNEILEYVLKNKGIYFHLSEQKLFGIKGMPDIMANYRNGNGNIPFCIELKIGKNKVSKEQKEMIEKLEVGGFLCGICYDNMENVFSFLRNVVKINI